MHNELNDYLEYVQAKANTDGLTSLGNTSAYIERQNALLEKMEKGSANFAAAVFDINDLKGINDNLGHLAGDRVIKGAASVLETVFAREDVYRIGGDEFIAVVENIDADEMNRKLGEVQKEIEKYNHDHEEDEGDLSVSAGCSAYDAKRDQKFRDVFKRADQMMYENKKAYYASGHNRRSDV
jgi:diguanylate cyclase (GGDEF)-like protein